MTTTLLHPFNNKTLVPTNVQTSLCSLSRYCEPSFQQRSLTHNFRSIRLDVNFFYHNYLWRTTFDKVSQLQRVSTEATDQWANLGQLLVSLEMYLDNQPVVRILMWWSTQQSSHSIITPTVWLKLPPSWILMTIVDKKVFLARLTFHHSLITLFFGKKSTWPVKHLSF